MDIKIGDFDKEIRKLLNEYGNTVYNAVNDKGLEAAEEVAVAELAAASPEDSGEFKKGWKGTGKKYKMVRYVGNTKTVAASEKLSKRSGDGKEKTVPLLNILEYSTTRGKPFARQTFENNADKIADALVTAVEQELK